MKKIWVLLKETVIEAKQDNLPIFAAGFSYYLLFSIIPLMVIVLSVAGKVIESGMARNVVIRQLAILFDSEVAGSFKAFLTSASKISISQIGFIGAIVIIYGASRIFNVLHQAISQIWDKENKRKGGLRGAVYARLRSVLMMLLPIVLVVFCFMADALLSAFKHTLRKYAAGIGMKFVFPILTHVFALFLFALVFACINKLLPFKKPSWRDVWCGAGLTTMVFAVGKFVFTSILHMAKITTVFGAAGSVILLLVWIYFSMLIFLYGSELTQVYTKRHGSWVSSPSA